MVSTGTSHLDLTIGTITRDDDGTYLFHNEKTEIRISKSETNPKFKFRNSKLLFLVLVICVLNICACFEFRISCFEITSFPLVFLPPTDQKLFQKQPCSYSLTLP